MRGRPELILLVALALAGLLLAPATRLAYGAVAYVPGVKPNNAAAYAASGSWNLPSPPSPVFSQFINLNFTSISVTKVLGSNVTAGQTFSYANGTTRQDIIQGGVDTDSGNITFWFIAANLTAGVPIYTTPNSPVINRTITESFAGSVRSINVLNSTQVSPNSSTTLMVWWDQKTGILLRIDFQLAVSTPSGPVGTASLHAKLFQTNVWSPGPGFGMLAVPNFLTVPVGGASNGTIIFLSERGFSGSIIIDYSLPCSTLCPTISINPMTVSLPSGGTVFASFSVAAHLGVTTATYPLSIFAGSGPFMANSTIVKVTIVSSQNTTTLSNDPNSKDWTIDSPTWSLKDGTLDGSGLTSLSPKIISTATFSSDRTVQVDFRTVSAGYADHCTAWIVGKYVDFFDKIVFLIHTTGTLEMVVWQGNTNNHYSANSTLTPMRWHHAKIVFSGSTAKAYVNGTLYLTVTDSIIGALGDSNVSLASWCNSESQFTNTTVAGSIVADELPIANFFLTPQPAQTGRVVSFNGGTSIDPDGFITNYSWNFGDGSTGLGEFPSHIYTSPGNYLVTLNVIDIAGLSSTVSHQVTVVQPLTHDVGIVSVDPEPKTAISGQTIVVGLQLVNLGQQAETVDIIVYYDSHVAATAHSVNVPLTGGIIVGNFTPPQPSVFPIFVSVAWDTSGVPAGNYTISATVILTTDQNPTNNHLTDGQVTILPPPVLNLTPTSGSLGDKVLVHGSGFPVSSIPGQPSSYPVTIQVTFDDQFLGLTTTSDGTFNFVFDVPHAQVGSHEIHAYAELYPFPVEATANFTVVPEPGRLAVSISVGAVYFPGDTSTIYVLATLNGNPAPSTVHLTLILPNGTATDLSLQLVTSGLYRASYKIPTNGSLGTYALSATVQQNGLSASNLGAFEVKPSWLQTHGQTILTASSVVGALGLVGVIAVAWRVGYLTKRRTDPRPEQHS